MRIRAALGLCVYMLSIATLLIALMIVLQVLRGPALIAQKVHPANIFTRVLCIFVHRAVLAELSAAHADLSALSYWQWYTCI